MKRNPKKIPVLAFIRAACYSRCQCYLSIQDVDVALMHSLMSTLHNVCVCENCHMKVWDLLDCLALHGCCIKEQAPKGDS